MIRDATPADADALARIYNPYVLESIITFEEEPVRAGDMAQRMQDVQAAGLPWFVAQVGDRITGYAYASKWKARSAYRFAVETTIYVEEGTHSRGVGSELYAALFGALKQTEVAVAIGGIALPNERSIAIHEKFGMRKVAHFEQVGFKFGQWIDVGYWQVRLKPRE